MNINDVYEQEEYLQMSGSDAGDGLRRSPAAGSEKIHQCAWVYDDDCFWATECGTAFCFTTDGPHENRYQFCPNCGRVIVVQNDTNQPRLD